MPAWDPRAQDEAQRARLQALVDQPPPAGYRARVEAAAEARAMEAAGYKVAPGDKAVSGTFWVPIIPVLFSNSGGALYPVQDLQTELFDGPWPTGTMREYYDEISYGKVDLVGEVMDWVQLPSSDTYYEGSTGCNGLARSCGARVGELLEWALASVDFQIDFGKFDNDGPDGIPNSGDDDGYADFVGFVQPEVGGECGGNTNLWSHRWQFSAWGVGPYFQTNDARAGGGTIRVNDYVIMPAQSCVNPGHMIEIGVFCHEFGHAFGLPDLYDLDDSSEGAGNWELMASGSWGGDNDSPQYPTHMGAWSKAKLGWIEPVNVAPPITPQWLGIPAVEVQPLAVKLRYGLGTIGDQYLLIENREGFGFDASIRAPGLLVWHVDDAIGSLWNRLECIDGPGIGTCGGLHYRVALEQADGEFDLERNQNRADAGDPFRAPDARRFTPYTLPWSYDYHKTATAQPSLTRISRPGPYMIAQVSYCTPGVDCERDLLLGDIIAGIIAPQTSDVGDVVVFLRGAAGNPGH